MHMVPGMPKILAPYLWIFLLMDCFSVFFALQKIYATLACLFGVCYHLQFTSELSMHHAFSIYMFVLYVRDFTFIGQNFHVAMGSTMLLRPAYGITWITSLVGQKGRPALELDWQFSQGGAPLAISCERNY